MIAYRWRRGAGRRGTPPARHRALASAVATMLVAAAIAAGAHGERTAPSSSQAPFFAPELVSATVGPRVVDEKLTRGGKPFLPRGFNLIGLLAPDWCTKTKAREAAARFGQPELDAARAWNANTLRFQVSQRGLADPGVSGADRASYLAKVVSGVQLARSSGFVVIVSLQDQDLSCGPAHPLPSDMSLSAWQVLAPALGDDAGVMFELFNEPNVDPTTAGWQQWRQGGTGPTSNLGDTPVGHQALVDAIRGLGATNVLIADGVDLAEKLRGLVPLTDPLGQLMYGVHPYYFDPGPTWWDQNYGTAAASVPVIATEWNYKADRCGTVREQLAPDLLAYLRTRNIGMLAHAFDVPGTTITSDWTWTPTNCAGAEGGSGQVTRDYFAGQVDPVPGPGQVPTPTALATAPDRVALSWHAASGPVAVYEVLRDGSVVATTTELRHDDTGLVPDVLYRYQVRALDESGQPGPLSEEVLVRPPAEPDLEAPTAPSQLQIPELTPDKVRLTWQPSDDNVGVAVYQVWRDGVVLGTTDGDIHSFTDATVTAGKSYVYSVVAADAAGNVGPPSEGVDAAVPLPDTSPPTPPTGLVGSWSGPDGVRLTWDGNSRDDTGVTGYVVERDGSTVGSTVGLAFTDTAPLSPGSHTYVVKAADAAGNISNGSSPAVVVVPDASAPSAPSSVSAALLSATTSRVTWAASSDDTAVVGYRVTRNSVRVATVTNTSFVDSGLPAAATLAYRVQAVDAAGNVSPLSSAATVKVPASAPNGLTGKYYDTATFGTLKVTRVDPALNFLWGTGSPATGVRPDTFSVRWTGNILPVSTAAYTFYLLSDEGARLWVNGRLVVDDWTLHSMRERQGSITLAPTQVYSIKVELRENKNSAALRLSWSTPTMPKAVVPTGQLLAR